MNVFNQQTRLMYDDVAENEKIKSSTSILSIKTDPIRNYNCSSCNNLRGPSSSYYFSNDVSTDNDNNYTPMLSSINLDNMLSGRQNKRVQYGTVNEISNFKLYNKPTCQIDLFGSNNRLSTRGDEDPLRYIPFTRAQNCYPIDNRFAVNTKQI